MAKIIEVYSEGHLGEIRTLFQEYERSLGVDLCFQGFQQELDGLPGPYAHPHGAIFLALESRQTMGCVALRKLADGVCEMKRLFVRPRFRGKGLGRTLAERSIGKAAALGYSTMRLDTLDRLKEALALYDDIGFKRIQPYYYNPLSGVVYFELNLKNSLAD